jgi:hypothetical protein
MSPKGFNIVTVNYANMAVTIEKENNGFQCLCAHFKCPRYFKTATAIVDHATATQMDWIGPKVGVVVFITK